MKISNRKELQNIAINHSAGFDYKDFMKIYRECTKEPFNILTIDTTLPASDPLRFVYCKICLIIIKMTVTDQIKILDRKIMQNEAQYDLDRKLGLNLVKYEYLTAENLGLKPSTVEQTKFEYSPLSKVFNKGLDKDGQKEGLFKRLKNIKDKNEKRLKIMEKNNWIKIQNH